jgi:alkylation response protein AidB-like acyl-CoA dehydrogenase
MKRVVKLNRDTHEVTATPKGFKEAYQQYIAAGWAALSAEEEYGGQALPLVVNQCFFEMLNSANQAWTMYPGLSHGAHMLVCPRTAQLNKKIPTCPNSPAVNGPAPCA